MIPIVSPWPFCKWAIDIVGPFPKGAGNAEYLVVAIDFFTKWVEAKPLRTITSKQVRDFFWESILCRFGVPNEIVSDNGTQFEEAVIPAKITVPTERIFSYSEGENDERLRTNLNYTEERREMAAIQEAANKQRIAKYYDKHVRARTYKVGDLVWCDNQASRAQNTGKLGPNWKGPYRVVGVSNTRTYKLAELKGNPIKRTWHATALKKCYM
ncbi:uncharacterized protein [Rutidosis leptorrhynchoides]|uniref:uncharacterized protein n=1 Tax=Rutidosis leptorrhynchoides TaxID=125765 RepID=UPI003A9A2EA0